MFTVGNTLFGAIWAGLAAVVAPMELISSAPVGLAPSAAMIHVWFLLGHLALKRRRAAGQPDTWPPPRS